MSKPRNEIQNESQPTERIDFGAWAGPIGAVAAFAGSRLIGLELNASIVAAVTVWCAIWWIASAVPLGVTSLLPLAIFPLTGVLTPAEVGAAYGHPMILLLLGGFMMAQALAHSGAHRRLALAILTVCGTDSARRLVFGFAIVAASFSMWISNTATTLMLLPVALALVGDLDDQRVSIAVLLAIAYGASIGGLGTPIGTPPNLIFAGVLEEQTGQQVNFFSWFSLVGPIVLVLVPLAAWWLSRNLQLERSLSLPSVGRWRAVERRALTIFSLAALLWVTRTAPGGGWRAWLDLPQANDAAVALLAVVVMAITPDGRGSRVLTWEVANKIPWQVLILFGGGITIAAGFTASGLAAIIANHLTALTDWPVWLMIGLLCLSVTFLTEVTSNTATATLLMPVLAAAAIAAGVDPVLLMLPAALSASCAFMLPVATAPNAIVFGSQRVPMHAMVRAGVALNLVGAMVITTWLTFRL